MTVRNKVATGVVSLMLVLGSVGGVVAVHAANPAVAPVSAATTTAVGVNDEADSETADGPDATATADNQADGETADDATATATPDNGADGETADDATVTPMPAR